MRQYYRYAASIQCVIKARGKAPFDGVVTDLSLGGAGVETAVDPGRTRKCTLVLSYNDSELKLPCTIRHSRRLWNRFVLHTKFQRMPEDQHLALEELVADLASAHAFVRWHAPKRIRVLGEEEVRRAG